MMRPVMLIFTQQHGRFMKIKINNKETEVKAVSVFELSNELSLPEKGIAVAVNNHLVPRTDWAQTQLKDGDDVVIIKAACGG